MPPQKPPTVRDFKRRAANLISRPLQTAVVVRNVPTIAGHLWRLSLRPGRWNYGFSALYTSTTLEVSLTERIKILNPATVLVGFAEISIQRAVDLTDKTILVALGVTPADLLRDGEWTLSQRIGTAIRSLGIQAIVVLAAIQNVHIDWPEIRVSDHTHSRAWTFPTPTEGKNVILLRPPAGHELLEQQEKQFVATIAGLNPGGTR